MEPRQQPLFAEQQPQVVHAVYAEVAVPRGVRGTFTYGVSREAASQVAVGARVVVPFGSARVVGYVVSLSSRLPQGVDIAKLRGIVSTLDVEPVFPTDLLQFLREAADYYFHPIGEVLRVAAPAVDSRSKKSGDGTLVARWAHVRQETFVRLSASAIESPPKLRGGRPAQVFAILESRGEVALTELRAQLREAGTVVQSLKRRGYVETEKREVPEDPFFGEPLARDSAPSLNGAQTRAVESIVGAIEHTRRATFLLFGVTGSGKTEVYLHAVDAAQRAGKGALILLPEIALTPQLVGRYRARFGDNLAVIHSGLGDSDRFAMWRKLRRGECRVAIGARSALFAPIDQLGLIIVDEEHDGSFKQDDRFRYHGRDMALLRAHRRGAVCVLGSATPSVESYQAALEGRYELLSLPDRATSAALPAVEIVDLRKSGAQAGGQRELLSLPLVRAIDATLSRGEQAIIFLNRRGFAPSVRCNACAQAIECAGCSVALVLHRREGLLKCHYCDFAVPFTGDCIRCHGRDLVLLGVGTEKLEQALIAAFPRARVGRLDRDVASGMGAEKVLTRLRDGEIDVLVGTQMVAKGHDIPRVTLVGVVAADSALSLPDFRASEKTFQLLAQVAGRAGRRELPGRVLIQTFQPEHPVIRHARQHDYLGFFAEEVVHRQALRYPPFGRLAAVRVDAPEVEKAAHGANEIARYLRALPELSSGEVQLVGPAPSPIERLRERYRMQMLLRCGGRPPLRSALSSLVAWLELTSLSHVRTSIDVDPVQML